MSDPMKALLSALSVPVPLYIVAILAIIALTLIAHLIGTSQILRFACNNAGRYSMPKSKAGRIGFGLGMAVLGIVLSGIAKATIFAEISSFCCAILIVALMEELNLF